MAVFNEMLSHRYGSALKKLFSMKGPTPVKQVAGELMPVLALFSGVELRFLEDWHRYGVSIQVGASVGNNGAVQVWNPSGSNLVAVIEKILFNEQVAGNVFGRMITTNIGDLITVNNAIRLDARSQKTTSATHFSSGTGVAVTGTSLFNITTAALQNYDIILFEEQEITLLPGDALRMTCDVNSTFNVTLMLRERFLEESERQ